MKHLFSKYPVAKKFRIFFLLICTAVVVASAVFFVLLFGANKELTTFFDGPFAVMKAQSTISDLINQNDTLIIEMSSTPSAAKANKAEIGETDQKITKQLAAIATNSDSKDASALQNLYSKVQSDANQIYTLSLAGKVSEAVAYSNTQYTESYDAFYTALNKVAASAAAAADTARDDYSSQQRTAMIWFGSLTFAALIITIFVMRVMSDGIVTPLSQIVTACDTWPVASRSSR